VTGDGDLDAAAAQGRRFLSLDVDGRAWPDVAGRDRVIADAQARLPGLRPCGFHSPYEAAAWSVLSQRIRIVQAARLRDDLVRRHGDRGAFPAPQALRALDLELPGRKAEYLHAVAEAALDGVLDAAALGSVDPDDAVASVQQVKGRGRSPPSSSSCAGPTPPTSSPARAPPRRRGHRALRTRLLPGSGVRRVAAVPLWAAVHLRTLREQRTHEISAEQRRPRDGSRC
jgi:DNA-3-methyladenine glycosylase II